MIFFNKHTKMAYRQIYSIFVCYFQQITYKYIIIAYKDDEKVLTYYLQEIILSVSIASQTISRQEK